MAIGKRHEIMSGIDGKQYSWSYAVCLKCAVRRPMRPSDHGKRGMAKCERCGRKLVREVVKG